ncbi:MAG: UDP-2,3-diacylglucosamine diphosphatase LpxI [Alphaproteobacteria bacterium]|nr:UDP-2,3-diacylglucosamine diphosphatase LpxI [Alphaproteobacteria bacterium]
MPACEEKPLSAIKKLGIIAGSGVLPARLAAACLKQNIEPFVVAFKGHTDAQTVQNLPHAWVHQGAAGRAMKILRKNGISDLVMIGAMRRPSLSELRPDFKTLAFFTKIGLKALGDDGFLKALRRYLENEGFRLYGAHVFLPDLLMPEGTAGRHQPNAQDWQDIKRGVNVLQTTGHLDIGQAVIVQNGYVLGIEAAEGTDALILRCAALKRKGPGNGVLIKLCKPGQDRDIDLPTIGPQTIKNLIDCGFSGLAVHADHSLIADINNVIALADTGNIFVTGLVPETTGNENDEP